MQEVINSKEIAEKTNWIKPLLDALHFSIYKKLLIDSGMGIFLVVGTTVKDLRNHVRVRMIFRPRKELTTSVIPKPRRLDEDRFRKIIDYGVKIGYIVAEGEHISVRKRKIDLTMDSKLNKIRRYFSVFFKFYSNIILKTAQLGLYSMDSSIESQTIKIYNTDLFDYLFKTIIADISTNSSGKTKLFLKNLPKTVVHEVKQGRNSEFSNIEIVGNYNDADIVVINNALWTTEKLKEKIEKKPYVIFHPPEDSWWGLFNYLCRFGEYTELPQKNKKIGELDIFVSDVLA